MNALIPFVLGAVGAATLRWLVNRSVKPVTPQVPTLKVSRQEYEWLQGQFYRGVYAPETTYWTHNEIIRQLLLRCEIVPESEVQVWPRK